tara:strand:- start:8345 stop:10153 length:1809 start_codon:yes stop_codon:yes gene_type:complete
MISNILEQEDVVKGMPDAALQQEAQAPSGMLQQFLVISEIKRRTDMRKRHQNQMQEQPQGTVAEQIVMEGITGIAPQQGVGMPPQMSPQMPPQQPPPGMPPMAMAAGGIVRMANGGFLDSMTPSGQTVKQQIDAVLSSGLSYPDVLAFISENFYGRPEVLEYIKASVEGEAPSAGAQFGMPPAAREMLDSEPYESKEARMPMLAGGSDIYKAPMILRAADALGMFDSFKGGQEQEPMAEPMASALAREVDAEYATPDYTTYATPDYMTTAPSRGVEMPSRARPDMGFGGIFEGMGESGAARKLSAIGGGIADIFGSVGDSMSESIRNAPIGRAIASVEQSAMRDPERYSRTEALPYKAGLESAKPVDQALEVVKSVQTDASDPDYKQDFSMMEDFFAELESGSQVMPPNTGDASVQGGSKIQSQAKSDPTLDISDILDESRAMTRANVLMQLGAGIAEGDLSGGLSRAGAAGMKGAQEQRALDMRMRLAKYQAGREDLRREDEAKRFERKMGMEESQFGERIKVMREDIAAKLGISKNANNREVLQSIDNALKGELKPERRAELLEMRRIMSSILSPELMAIMGQDAPTGSSSPPGFSIRRP